MTSHPSHPLDPPLTVYTITGKEKFSESRRKHSKERDGSGRYSSMQAAGPATEKARRPTEHGTPVSRYEQLMAAGGPQMLATSNV